MFKRVLPLIFSASALAAPPPAYDLLLKNAQVVDGTGAPAYRGQIGISGERIAYVGKAAPATAKRTLDLGGKIAAPGFIDMLGQSEEFLLIDPRAMSKVKMGVTTEVSGEGSSVAPFNDALIKAGLDFWSHFHITVDWHDYAEYFRRLERQGSGINLAMYVGATQVRKYVIGAEDRAPTAAELAAMRQLVATAMQQGAFGVSTALQYVPARFAHTEEIVALAKEARKYGGIYATHQRSEGDNLESSLTEVFSIADQAEIPVEIFHLKVAYRQNWGRMGDVLTRIETAQKNGKKIYADIYPYTAASTSLGACVPPWALEGGTEAFLTRLKDPATRAKIRDAILNDTQGWENFYLGSGGPTGVLISSVLDQSLKENVGKTLAEIATVKNKDPVDAMLDLLIADRNNAAGIYFIMSESDLKKALAAPWITFGTDGSARAIDGPLAESKGHPRAWGTFARVLGKYTRDQKLLKLEDAVHRMTQLPAERVGLRERGTLRANQFADVVVFDPKTVKDAATYENPQRYAEGISHVIVNGQLVVNDGQRTPAMPGKVLRGPGYVAK